MVTCTYSPIIWERDTRELEIQREPQIHSEFEASLSYLRPCLSQTRPAKLSQQGKAADGRPANPDLNPWIPQGGRREHTHTHTRTRTHTHAHAGTQAHSLSSGTIWEGTGACRSACTISSHMPRDPGSHFSILHALWLSRDVPLAMSSFLSPTCPLDTSPIQGEFACPFSSRLSKKGSKHWKHPPFSLTLPLMTKNIPLSHPTVMALSQSLIRRAFPKTSSS